MMSDNQEAAAFASTSEAVDRLAKRLYSCMIKLDPVGGDSEWSALPDDERHFYRQLIEDLVRSPDLVLVGSPTKNQRGPQERGSHSIGAPHAVGLVFDRTSLNRSRLVCRFQYGL